MRSASQSVLEKPQDRARAETGVFQSAGRLGTVIGVIRSGGQSVLEQRPAHLGLVTGALLNGDLTEHPGAAIGGIRIGGRTVVELGLGCPGIVAGALQTAFKVQSNTRQEMRGV